MIKKDIIQAMSNQHGAMTLDEVGECLDTLLTLLRDNMAEGITIANFGKFRWKKGIVREVVVPTGKKVLTSATGRAQFLPSPKLKTYLNSTTHFDETQV